MPDIAARVRSRPGLSALVELGLLALPAVPAYLWLWPNVAGSVADVLQLLAYGYMLAAALFVGLRHWSPAELGLNRQGIGMSLACGGVFILFMVVGRLALGLAPALRPFEPVRLVGQALYYFGAVAVTEELLYRGVLYRALLEWRGARWAVVGSAVVFGAQHVWAGPLIAGLVGIGLLWGAIRLRAGGITGLILVHGLYDFVAMEGWPDLAVPMDRLPQIPHPEYAILGDALLLGLVIYLWKIDPVVRRRPSG